MKDYLLTKLLCLLLLFSFGCATSTEMKLRPADFRLQYHWSEGSLPPPYHSEYTIRLGPGLHGEIEFQPDYPSSNTPMWTETFEIEDEDLEKLYALMWAKGVFAENWRQSDEVPVGGSADRLQVTADGQQVAVPSYVAGASEAEAISEVYAAINALVPEPVWTKLNLQYEQYKQDFLTEQEAASPAAPATPTSLPPTPTPSATSIPGGANELIVTADSEGIIFSAENAPTTGLTDHDEDYWMPSQAEVLELEKQLGPYLQQAAPQDYPGPLRDLSEYKRQYVGVVIKGQRVIFVNFFCNAHDVDWQREFVFISDGGSCYFEVKYDVQTGEFSDLSIHGEA